MTAWPPAALVLAAGVGTRLHPLTLVRAKPAVPVAGTPLIGRILQALAAAGVRDVVINLHHLPHTLTGIVGEGREFGVSVRYSWEPRILGSAGGPRRALPLLEGDPYLLVNGDTLPTVDLRALWADHHAHGALVTMTLIPNPAPERYGGVLLDHDGWVTGFCRRGDPRPSYHFFYAQVVSRSVFAPLSDGDPAESVGQVYPRLMETTRRAVRGFVCDAPFIEVGTPADYVRVQCDIAAAAGTDPFAPGERASIAPSARILRSIVWDDVQVCADAQVEDCILADGVVVLEGARLTRSVVVTAPPGYAPRPDERVEGRLLLAPLDTGGERGAAARRSQPAPAPAPAPVPSPQPPDPSP